MERSNERCTNGEKKIIDLEEKLKVNYVYSLMKNAFVDESSG